MDIAWQKSESYIYRYREYMYENLNLNYLRIWHICVAQFAIMRPFRYRTPLDQFEYVILI